ncbi:hypothetical protein HanXRQr2_Chr14g0654301 [Helianthus annuus]|uniref:Uncharacterized protein n=1 Tax=Helianthus annuus TaxID=4232 RepID=A0A9K3ECI6_HELAN|nr:hypothetical protein HanXRQr2_Chr14g0654301 [Helianthus annuus]
MGTSSLTIFKCNRNCCKPSKNQVAIEPTSNIHICKKCFPSTSNQS